MPTAAAITKKTIKYREVFDDRTRETDLSIRSLLIFSLVIETVQPYTESIHVAHFQDNPDNIGFLCAMQKQMPKHEKG
jgi:hypothetical protein